MSVIIHIKYTDDEDFPYEVGSDDGLAFVDNPYGVDSFRSYHDALEYANAWATALDYESGITAVVRRL